MALGLGPYNRRTCSFNLTLPHCEGLTAPEWRECSVDLQKGYAHLAKELLAKNVESDELRLQNHNPKKAHGTAVEALEALQLSHAAVLLDRDRLVSVFGSEIHDSRDG